jgi:rhodanese-related sulfurtransferase
MMIEASSDFFSVEETKKLLKNKEAILIDIREDIEIQIEGQAKDSIHIPFSLFHDPQNLDSILLQLDKNKTLILYCKSGQRSAALAEFFKSIGYKAENMGGLRDWIAAGGEVLK